MKKIIWQSSILFTPPADTHCYRVVLTSDSDGYRTTFRSIEAEVQYGGKTQHQEKWQTVEKFSKQYGKILQLALLEMVEKGEA